MSQPLYRVAFHNRGEVYEVYARSVSQGGLYGFVEIEELVFGERTQLVVDPGEERSEEHTSELQSRFDLVCRLLREKKKVTSTSHTIKTEIGHIPIPSER